MSMEREPRETMLTSLDQILIPDPSMETEIEDQFVYRPDPLIGLAGLNKLKPNQEKFLVLKLHGVSDAKAARGAGVVPATAYHWKTHDENFALAYDYVVNHPIEMASQTTAFAFAKAMMVLADMLDHKQVAVRQWAVDTLIRITGADNKTKKVEVKHEYSRDDVDKFRKAIKEGGPD